MMKERVFTLETRLKREEVEYFERYISFYNKVYREVWQDYAHGETLNAKYVTRIGEKHHLLKRTVNSIVREVKGRAKALRELQKQQCNDLNGKIQALDEGIAKLKAEITVLSKLAGRNELNKENMVNYKNKKKILFALQSKKLNDQNSIERMGKRSKLSFGSKSFWRKQYHLEENGFKSHIGWYNQYVRKRDKYIYYIGSSDETCGNQMVQMRYDKHIDYFHCKIRKEKEYCQEDKYLYFDIDFKSPRREVLIESLQGNKAMSYRILRRGKKWYLQVMFSVAFAIVTDRKYGCLGVDFNDGFFAVTETDRQGNIVGIREVELKHHGGGNRAKTEMEKIVRALVLLCREYKKALVIEDLDFGKKKSKILHKKGKPYNRMIHRLDYSRFAQLCNNCATVYGVELIKVNPAYTSQIAKQKYCEQRKLSIHIGASYVIARRGQGFQDQLIA